MLSQEKQTTFIRHPGLC